MKKKEPKLKKLPMFKTPEQMARISGIGENTLRTLMDKRELDFVQIGNRRLIADEAMWAWYDRVKVSARKEEEPWQSQQGKSKISVISPAN